MKMFELRSGGLLRLRVMNFYQHPRKFRKALLLVMASAVPLSTQVASAQMKFSDLFGPGSAQPEQGSASSAFSRATQGMVPAQVGGDPEYYVRLATDCQRRADYAGAKGYLDRAIAISPSNSRYHVDRAVTLTQMNHYSQALDDVSEGIRLSPDDASYYHRRAVIYLLLKEYKLALIDARRAVSMMPTNEEFLLDIATIYGAQEDWKNVILACTNLINVEPEFGRAYAIRAEAKENLGDLPGSKEDFARAITLGYHLRGTQ